MTLLLLVFVATLSVPQDKPQETRPKVPDDSIDLIITGCLKGRVLAVSDVRQVDVQTAPDVRSRTFRLAGKKDVMDEVKKLNGQFVEVTGLVKRSALDDQGVNIGRRVTMSGGSPSARGTGIPSPANNVPVMDVWSVAPRAGTCPGE